MRVSDTLRDRLPSQGEWIKANPSLGDVIVPEVFSAYLRASVRDKMVAAITGDTRDAIKLLREMLRQAERGEIVLTGLRIKNQQKDRWEVAGNGSERLRLDNRFKVELEMRAYDRFAQSQPPPMAVAVDVDESAMEVLEPTVMEYVTLQGRNPRTNYRLPLMPVKTLATRIFQRISGGADREYNTVRMDYAARDRLMLEGVISEANLRDESPITFMGLDLIVEAPDGRLTQIEAAGDTDGVPRFEDSDDAWEGVTDYDAMMGRTTTRRSINERTRAPTPQDLQALDARVEAIKRAKKPAEPAKRKTPAGASAAREIIFDD